MAFPCERHVASTIAPAVQSDSLQRHCPDVLGKDHRRAMLLTVQYVVTSSQQVRLCLLIKVFLIALSPVISIVPFIQSAHQSLRFYTLQSFKAICSAYLHFSYPAFQQYGACPHSDRSP